MAISSALSLAQKIEGVITAIDTGKAFTDSGTALEVTAALAHIAGVTAVGGLVATAGRFTDPLIRLGGVLDATDPAFAELKLWRDTSQDGVSQSGEFLTLADAGIVSLNLAPTLTNQRLANGNTLARTGSFTRANGATGAMGEFHFATDTLATRFAETLEIPDLGGNDAAELMAPVGRAVGIKTHFSRDDTCCANGVWRMMA